MDDGAALATTAGMRQLSRPSPSSEGEPSDSGLRPRITPRSRRCVDPQQSASGNELHDPDAQASNVTEMGWEILLQVVKRMDSTDRSAWRLVNKAACHAVYHSTRVMTPIQPYGIEWSAVTALPQPLLHKCNGLKQLPCHGLRSLTSIHGLPAGLEVLEINSPYIIDLSSLQRCTALMQLSIRDPSASTRRPEMFQQLPSVLQQLTGLQQLDLSLNGACMQAAAPAIQALTRLQQLDLAYHNLSLQGAQALAAAIQLTRLHRLGITAGRQPISAEGVLQALVPALEHLSGLQQLHLGGNKMGAGGARSLAPVLHHLTGLQHLSLNDNDMGAEAAQALAPALLQLTGLRRLDLSANHVGAEGARALAPALLRLTGLQRLDLGFNDVGADGVRALAPALQQLTGLQQLNLRANDLGAEGAQALAPALLHLTRLRWLDLCQNCMGDEGAQALDLVIRMLPKLYVKVYAT